MRLQRGFCLQHLGIGCGKLFFHRRHVAVELLQGSGLRLFRIHVAKGGLKRTQPFFQRQPLGVDALALLPGVFAALQEHVALAVLLFYARHQRHELVLLLGKAKIQRAYALLEGSALRQQGLLRAFAKRLLVLHLCNRVGNGLQLFVMPLVLI
ncbi:MAG: hypothetical protein BWY35_02422 [Firmicutes bacterium ADurb.Bin248]|nr:MAG: hypothetical protein BWY35_02422 [Firmicutes bacterium ADurb.Bin248]